MSIFSNVIGWVVGDSKSAGETVNTATKMLDNAFYTDQEKSADHGKVLDWYLKYQQATSPQNLARRKIAFLIGGLWVFLILLGVTARGIETTHGNDAFSTYIFNTLTEHVSTPFSLVVGFYFLTHLARGMKNG